MAAPVRPTQAIRFGDFEADLQAGQLRKHGVRIKLQEQPFQILAMMLEKPGEVVTREELRQRLWPADTFVDFDHGLNNAINRLREALNDSADAPRFIETLPRRGYRFVADVNVGSTTDMRAVAPADSAGTVEAPAVLPQKAGAVGSFSLPSSGRLNGLWFAAAGAGIVVAVILGLNFQRARSFRSS